jgi:TPR repeat protein
MMRLSEAHAKGCHLAYDLNKSLSWLRSASDAGSTLAHVMLAVAMHDGLFGLTMDKMTAIEIVDRINITEELTTSELSAIGHFYCDMRKDTDKAMPFLRKAADAGHPRSQIKLIELLGRNRDTRDEAFGIARALVGAGNSDAKVAYAKLKMQFGDHGDDKRSVSSLLHSAAAQQNSEACLELAKLYLTGANRNQMNPFEASRWLLVVVDDTELRDSDPEIWQESCRLLAGCYRDGIGVPQDRAISDMLLESIGEK